MESQALVPLLLTVGVGVLVLLRIFLGSSRSTRRSRRQVPTMGTTTVVVTDPALVRLMLIDHADAFSNRPMAHFPKDFCGIRSNSINSVPYGPAWRAFRGNLTAGIFHPTRLGALTPLQREAVDALIAGLPARGVSEVVVRDKLHAAVFALVVRMCFGDGLGEREVRAMEHEVRQTLFTFQEDYDLFSGSRLARLLHWRRWLRYSGIFSRLSKLILPAIAARQRSRCSKGGGDTSSTIRLYVDSLLDLRIPNSEDGDGAAANAIGRSSKRPLSNKEMVRLVFEFLGANTESIVSCVEWTLAHLVTHPAAQNKLHHEITSKGGVRASEERLRGLPYLRAVILESLRLHAPVPYILRDVAGHDAAICGAQAPPADDTPERVRLVIKVREVGRNAKVWTNPDEFRPERFLPGGEAEGVGAVPGPKEIRMVPFGVGRRYCPGVELGLVHVGYFLAALVREFEWALPLHGHSIDLRENRSFIMVMKTPLRARITPRTPTMSKHGYTV